MHCISAIGAMANRLKGGWNVVWSLARGGNAEGCARQGAKEISYKLYWMYGYTKAHFPKYKAPHPLSVSSSTLSSWKPSVNMAPCLTRPNYGSTPCAPRSRRSYQSTRPGPMVIRASSSDRVTRESSVRARVRAFPFDQYQFGSLRSCSFNSCCMPSSGSPRKR